MCVCILALITRHAKRMLVMWRLSGSTIFFHTISKGARFSEKKFLNIKCVFWFCLQIYFSDTFLFLGRIQWDLIIKVPRSHVKYPLFLSHINVIWILSIIWKNAQIENFIIIRLSGNRVVQCEPTYMTKLVVAFRNFANVPKNYTFIPTQWIYPFVTHTRTNVDLFHELR